MANFGIKTIDPKTIESTYFRETPEFDEYEESEFLLEDLEPYLAKLPAREVDLIDMYYRGRKKQKEIAEFFNVSQGAISHRLSRAKKRLIFLRDMPKIENQTLRLFLSEYFVEMEVNIIMNMVQTTCQSKTADIVNEMYKLEGKSRMTQVKVRHKFERAIEKLRGIAEQDEKMKKVHTLAVYIKANPYLLHEVVLPHFYRPKKADFGRV